MLIVHTTPEGLTGGFLAHLSAQMLNGLADGYVPLAAIAPLPPLYSSGIRYALEPNHGQGWEDFANPWQCLARGWGDCDDLILYRLVELRLAGERAHCAAEWAGNGVHVLVRRKDRKRQPDGTLGTREDPSINLGATSIKIR